MKALHRLPPLLGLGLVAAAHPFLRQTPKGFHLHAVVRGLTVRHYECDLN